MKDSDVMGGRHSASWRYMWLGAGTGLFITLILLLAFVGVTVHGVMRVISAQQNADLAFIFSGISLVNLTLLRLLAILAGAAIAFAGLAVSFFVHEKATSIRFSSVDEAGNQSPPLQSIGTPQASFSAYSPGLVGVVVGAVIIMTSLLNTSRHEYNPGEVITTYMLPDEVAADTPARKLRPLHEVLGEGAK